MVVIEGATVVFSPRNLRDLKMLEEAGIEITEAAANNPATPHSVTGRVDLLADGYVEVTALDVIFSPTQIHHIERP